VFGHTTQKGTKQFSMTFLFEIHKHLQEGLILFDVLLNNLHYKQTSRQSFQFCSLE